MGDVGGVQITHPWRFSFLTFPLFFLEEKSDHTEEKGKSQMAVPERCVER